jgi:protein TonB
MRGPALIPMVLLATALLLAGCSDQPERPRKQQTVKLLPDTPPPPPPPPKPEEKPPPKAEDKPQPQAAPKPVDTPQPQVLKSDEAAGQGPGSGIEAGRVTQDYVDQKQGTGATERTVGTVGSAAPVESGASRMAANAYGNAASRALNDFLARDKAVKLRDYQVRVQLWLTATGSLQRAELVDSTGDPQTDEALRSALNRFPGTGNPPPARMPQPMRVLVSNRLIG